MYVGGTGDRDGTGKLEEGFDGGGGPFLRTTED